jgi:regulator of protease activity HflC (stomatin/prohibitin superfamily)
MTEDNVPCSIDGVVFFKVNDPEKNNTKSWKI